MRVTRTISTPVRASSTMTWDELWEGPDDGLIACWEVGRELAATRPAVATAALAGELVPLPWKGGVEGPLKTGRKFGSLFYLAMWHGLRGEDLDLDPTRSVVKVICSRFGVQVTFTFDSQKYRVADGTP